MMLSFEYMKAIKNVICNCYDALICRTITAIESDVYIEKHRLNLICILIVFCKMLLKCIASI